MTHTLEELRDRVKAEKSKLSLEEKHKHLEERRSLLAINYLRQKLNGNKDVTDFYNYDGLKLKEIVGDEPVGFVVEDQNKSRNSIRLYTNGEEEKSRNENLKEYQAAASYRKREEAYLWHKKHPIKSVIGKALKLKKWNPNTRMVKQPSNLV